jgi:dihydrofolate reductase
MAKVKLYIAASLDGFIADADGGVGWLSEASSGSEAGEDYGYEAFYDSIGSLVMGRRTYEQVLGFGEWPYSGKPAYVFSRDAPEGEHPNAEFAPVDPARFVPRLLEESGEDIWLVGGAGLIASFREESLIDEYVLSVMPVVLGGGVPLFEGKQPKASLRLVEAQSYESGVVQLRYETD